MRVNEYIERINHVDHSKSVGMKRSGGGWIVINLNPVFQLMLWCKVVQPANVEEIASHEKQGFLLLLG